MYLGTSSSRPSVVTRKSVAVTLVAMGYSIVFNIYSIVFGLSLVFCYYQSWSFCIYTLEFSNFVIEIFASICSWDFMKLYYCFLNVFFLLSLVQEWHCVMIMLC